MGCVLPVSTNPNMQERHSQDFNSPEIYLFSNERARITGISFYAVIIFLSWSLLYHLGAPFATWLKKRLLQCILHASCQSTYRWAFRQVTDLGSYGHYFGGSLGGMFIPYIGGGNQTKGAGGGNRSCHIRGIVWGSRRRNVSDIWWFERAGKASFLNWWLTPVSSRGVNQPISWPQSQAMGYHSLLRLFEHSQTPELRMGEPLPPD